MIHFTKIIAKLNYNYTGTEQNLPVLCTIIKQQIAGIGDDESYS